MRRQFLTLWLTLLAAPALGEGHEGRANLDIVCNDNGAVVTLGAQTVAPGRVYYLGKECDAFQPSLGTGRWYYAAGAFIIDIGGQGLRFGADLDCPALPYCRP